MAHSKVKQYRDKGSSLHPKDSKEYKLIQYYMDVLEYSYTRYRSTLDRLKVLNNAYENAINTTLFPTTSKMAIPDHFAMTQEMLPLAMDYVFPDAFKTYELNPQDVDVELETLDKVEYGLNYMVRQTMKARYSLLPSITNAIKTGVGYSAVVPTIVTPTATINYRVLKGGVSLGEQRRVGVGKPEKTLKIEDIGLGEIIPTDDGTDFNGHNRVSHVFRFKIYQEEAFRRLYAKMKVDCEDVDVKGDVEKIIAQAKDFNFNTNIPMEHIIADLGGYDLQQRHDSTGRTFTMIPVIRCYGDMEEVWIANGTTVIYQEKDSLQVLRRDLIKWGVTVDSNKWHPMNPAEAGLAISQGNNLYVNMLNDLIVRATRPYMLYDKGRFGDKPPVVGMNGDVGVDGTVEGAIKFEKGVSMDNGHIAHGNMLDRLYENATGVSKTNQSPSPGMVRGGLHALEEVMQKQSSRQRMAAMILEMGGVAPLGEITMIHMQLMASGKGITFKEREYDTDSGKGRVKNTTLTLEDLNAAYAVSVDTRGKDRTTTDLNERVTIYQATANSPYYDPYTRESFLVGQYPTLRAGLYSREKSRKIQEKQAEQAELEAKKAQSTNNVAGGTTQAVEQGASQGGALQ